MGNLSSLNYVTGAVEGALTFRVRSNEYFVPIAGAINVEEEIIKLTEELNYTEGGLAMFNFVLQFDRWTLEVTQAGGDNSQQLG